LDELTAHLRSYLRRRLGGLPDAAEDLLQELLVAVHNKRHTYDPKQALTAWVQAIARYKLTGFTAPSFAQRSAQWPTQIGRSGASPVTQVRVARLRTSILFAMSAIAGDRQ
jgi:hypothetical protein